MNKKRWAIFVFLIIAALLLKACAPAEVEAESTLDPYIGVDGICLTSVDVYLGRYILYPATDLEVRIVEDEDVYLLSINQRGVESLQSLETEVKGRLDDYQSILDERFDGNVIVSLTSSVDWMEEIHVDIDDDMWLVVGRIDKPTDTSDLEGSCSSLLIGFDLRFELGTNPGDWQAYDVFLNDGMYEFQVTSHAGSNLIWRISKELFEEMIFGDSDSFGIVTHKVRVVDTALDESAAVEYQLLRSDPDLDDLLLLMENAVQLNADALESRVNMRHWSSEHGITVSINSGKWHHWFTGEEYVEGAIYLP